MDEQALNRKLARWAGFKWYDNYWGDCWCEYPDGSKYHFHPESGYDNSSYDTPEFTKSLDACFKRLVLKVVRELADIDLSTDREAMYKLFSLWIELFWTLREQPVSITLALCLAVEKLIDGEQHG